MISLDNEDFGFSSATVGEGVADESSKLDQMMALIDTLLVNLSANPEKTTIKWPDRIKRIAEFRNQLNQIRNS